MIERATFRPVNGWFSTIAQIKPISVLSPTTLTTQISVFSITWGKAGEEIASWKFFRPAKSPTTPARLILLNASRNTMPIGNTTKISISRMLGRIQRYGSHLWRTNTERMLSPLSYTKKEAGVARPPENTDYLPVIFACSASSSSFTLPPVSACCSTSMTPCFTSFHSALVVG